MSTKTNEKRTFRAARFAQAIQKQRRRDPEGWAERLDRTLDRVEAKNPERAGEIRHALARLDVLQAEGLGIFPGILKTLLNDLAKSDPKAFEAWCAAMVERARENPASQRLFGEAIRDPIYAQADANPEIRNRAMQELRRAVLEKGPLGRRLLAFVFHAYDAVHHPFIFTSPAVRRGVTELTGYPARASFREQPSRSADSGSEGQWDPVIEIKLSDFPDPPPPRHRDYLDDL